MSKQRLDDEGNSDGINLLITILIRYPEIGTVSFNPQNDSIKLTFMLNDILSNKDFTKLKSLLLDSINAYHVLKKTHYNIAEFNLNTYDNVAIIESFRDVATLTQNEIALIIAILRDKLKKILVVEHNDAVIEDDLRMQEELIENMLANIKSKQNKHNLIGIREEGRVLVFNK